MSDAAIIVRDLHTAYRGVPAVRRRGARPDGDPPDLEDVYLTMIEADDGDS